MTLHHGDIVVVSALHLCCEYCVVCSIVCDEPVALSRVN